MSLRTQAAGAIAAIMLIPTASLAEVDYTRADLNHRNGIDTAAEARIVAIYRESPAIAAFDTIHVDGKLDVDELALLNADAEKKLQADPGTVASLIDQATAPGGIPLKNLKSARSGMPDPCATGQGIYVRRDRVDTAAYTRSVSKSVAKGAAFQITDKLPGSITATIDGTVSAVLARSPCVARPADAGPGDAYLSAYAVAPWIQAKGQISSTPATDHSKLTAGLDLQAEIFSGPFDAQYLNLAPYYQTDFQGKARIYGASATWIPYKLNARLGGRYNDFSDAFDFFWTAQATADVRRVDDPGQTGLHAGDSYAWLGGTVALNSWLFPAKFDDRIYLNADYSYFWNALSGSSASLFNAALGYNITPDGSTSVALEYSNGTDKDTLDATNQLTMTLNFKQ